MKCSACKERLAAYQDGELAAVQASEITAHLAQCSECQAFSESMTEIELRLAHLAEIEPIANFTQLVMAKVAVMPAPAARRISMWWLGVYDLFAWALLAGLVAAGILRWQSVVAGAGELFGKLALASEALYRVAGHLHLTTFALAGAFIEVGGLVILAYVGRHYLAGMRTALFGAQTT